MSAKLLDGKLLAKNIKSELKIEIDQAVQSGRRTPGLAVVLVGENPASEVYVGHKRRACEAVGIHSFEHRLPASTTAAALLNLIDRLNSDDQVDGILVQLPLPDGINSQAILEAINPKKDVDGFHPYNLGRLTQRRPALRPCTPYGIMKLLAANGITVTGMDALVVGASNIVGRPMMLELLLEGATVTTCHRFTKDLQQHVERADLLVVAVGKQNIVQADWIKSGTVVIDVGIHRSEDGELSGDLNFKVASERAAWITPVPGGVGPMTVAMLLVNTFECFKN